MTKRPFVSVKEAAALLGVSERFIYNKLWDGTLPCVRLGKRKIRILMQEVAKMATAKSKSPAFQRRAEAAVSN